MSLDKFGLIEGNKEQALLNTSKYYFDLLLEKKRLEKEFTEKYPHRQRRDDEDLVEYDEYLTNHVNTYNSLIMSRCEAFTALDIYFDGFCQCVKTYGKLTVHPTLPDIELDMDSAISFAVANAAYDQHHAEILRNEWYIIDTILDKRKHKLKNYVSDLLMLFMPKSIAKTMYKWYSSERNPTFLSRFL